MSNVIKKVIITPTEWNLLMIYLHHQGEKFSDDIQSDYHPIKSQEMQLAIVVSFVTLILAATAISCHGEKQLSEFSIIVDAIF